MIRVAVDHIEQLSSEHGQLMRRRAPRLGDAISAEHHFVHHPIMDGGEERLLRADVVIERTFAEIVRDTQFRDARGVVPAPREDARRRVDDRLATRLPVRPPSRITGRCRLRHRLRRYRVPISNRLTGRYKIAQS